MGNISNFSGISRQMLTHSWGSGFGISYNNNNVRFISVYVPGTVLKDDVSVSQRFVTNHFTT